ncbi:MAG: hypothetical protein P8Y67_13625 [Alphaproteobacteria bacterium]
MAEITACVFLTGIADFLFFWHVPGWIVGLYGLLLLITMSIFHSRALRTAMGKVVLILSLGLCFSLANEPSFLAGILLATGIFFILGLHVWHAAVPFTHVQRIAALLAHRRLPQPITDFELQSVAQLPPRGSSISATVIRGGSRTDLGAQSQLRQLAISEPLLIIPACHEPLGNRAVRDKTLIKPEPKGMIKFLPTEWSHLDHVAICQKRLCASAGIDPAHGRAQTDHSFHFRKKSL